MSSTFVTISDDGALVSNETIAENAPRDAEERVTTRNDGNTTFRSSTGLGISQSVEVHSTGTTAPAEGADPLDAAHDDLGYPVSRGDLKGNTYVRFHDMDIRLSLAVEMGFVKQTAPGIFETVGAQAGNEKTNSEQEKIDPATQTSDQRFGDANDEDRDQKFLSAIADADPEFVGEFLNAGIEAAVVDGASPNFDADRVAKALGISTLDAGTRYGAMVASWQDTADAAIRAAGCEDVGGAYEAARASKPEALRDAVRRLLYNGDADGFADIGRQYAGTLAGANANYSADDLLGAEYGSGIVASQDARTGAVMLSIPGLGTVDAQAALRKGLVKAG